MVLPSTASTQDAARDLVRAGRQDVVGVRAEYQSAGRVRGPGRWIAPPGTCLLITYIVPEPAEGPLPTHLLSLGAGVAVAQAVQDLTGLPPRLKWPNDVLLNARKTAGILIERLSAACPIEAPPLLGEGSQARHWSERLGLGGAPGPGGASVVLIGIGLNVNVDRFPRELERTATSLRLEARRVFHIPEVEESVRKSLFHGLESCSEEALIARWRKLDATKGCRYAAEVDGRHVTGTAVGVSNSGALLLRLAGGEHIEVISATSKI